MVTKNLQTNETIKFLFGGMNSLRENTYQTFCGTIHYWSSILSMDAITLIFLPGLTADHRLFDKQVECFEEKYNIMHQPMHLRGRFGLILTCLIRQNG